MNLKERLEAARLKMAEIKAGVEKGEKTAEDLNEAIKEVEALQADIKAAEEADKLIKSLGAPAPKDESGEAEPKAKSLGENFANFVKSMNVEKKFNLVAPVYVKANTDPMTSPSGAVDFATTFDRRVVEAARVPLVVADLFGAETISGSTLVYLIEGAMEGAPAVTAEGTAKPQVHFADPTPKTVSLAKIAAFIRESDEYIHDFAFLESAINGRLVYQLGLVEQNKIVSDLLGTSGIQSDSTSWKETSTAAAVADLILKASMDVQQMSGFAADGIMLNPTDWYKLRVAKDGENRYYGGGFFGAQSVNNLWGIPVCVTPSIAAGNIMVGAFKTCGSVVRNGGISVDATNSNKDDFEKNLMTIRAEERMALAIRQPAGFKLLTMDAESDS